MLPRPVPLFMFMLMCAVAPVLGVSVSVSASASVKGSVQNVTQLTLSTSAAPGSSQSQTQPQSQPQTQSTQQVATTSKAAACSKGWSQFNQVTDSVCVSWLKASGADSLNVSCASLGGTLLAFAQKTYLTTLQALFGEMWYDDDLNPVAVLLGVRYTNGRWNPPDFSSSLAKLVHADDPQCSGTSTACPDKCLTLKMKNETLYFGLESCTFPFKNAICSLAIKQS